MNYYPIMLDLSQSNVLIVGGGTIATRKLKGLLQSDVESILVVAPIVSDELKEMVRLDSRVSWKHDTYADADLVDRQLVFAATNNEELNAMICHSTRKLNKLVCNVSDSIQGDFITPVVVREDDIVLSFSTNGKSPAWSKQMKNILREQFVMPYGMALSLMGRLRDDLERDNVKMIDKLVVNNQALNEVLEVTDDQYDAWYQSLLDRLVIDKHKGVE